MGLRRRVGIALVIAGVAVGVALPVWAGGWAVVTLDSLPQGLKAGEPFSIGFTVRQHGRTPISDLDPAPSVEARHAATGDLVRATAASGGGPGHYSAQIVLPSAGAWKWGIRGFGDQVQPMPDLSVADSQPATAPLSIAGNAVLWLAVGLVIAGILLAFRRRYAFSAGLIALAAVAGAISFRAVQPSSPVVEAASPPGSGVGQALFVAKGCVVCHVHERVPESESISASIGPDLSLYRNDPVFLSRWLADPASVRPLAEMPDLELSAGEIDALIAFLNSDEGG